MSSWRNLMTPPQEKYCFNEGLSPLEESYFQEKLHQEVSDFTEDSNRQHGTTSDALKELQSQMNKLKVDLDRDSIKRRDTVGTYSEKISLKPVSPHGRGILEATPCTVKQTKTKGILRSTQGRDLQSASTCSGFSTRFQKKEVEVRDFDQSLGSATDGSFEGKESEYRETKKLDSSKINRSYKKENIVTTEKHAKKTSRRVEFKTEDDEGSESSNSLQETLLECCQQIKDLKQIAFESQNQISLLCQEVTKQKKDGEEVRKYLGFDLDGSLDKRSNFTSVKSTSRGSLGGNYRNYWTEGKNKQEMMSSVKEGSHSCRVKYTENKPISSFLKFSEERFSEESTKESPAFRQSYKEAGVQCDVVMDEIIDYDQEEIERKEKEVVNLKSELDTTKGQKNDMILTFQRMLSLLEASNKRDAQEYQEKIIETQNTFSEFYDIFNSKLLNVSQSKTDSQKYGCKLTPRPENSQYVQKYSNCSTNY